MSLYRSRRDSKITGLCGGVAEALGIDSNLLRLIVVITTFCTGGTVILIYIAASLIISKEPPYPTDRDYEHDYRSDYRHDPGFDRRQDRRRHHRHDHRHDHHHGFSRPGPGGATFGTAYEPPPGARADRDYDNHASHIDEMMDSIEKKAMQKEIDELRAKIKKMEKGD